MTLKAPARPLKFSDPSEWRAWLEAQHARRQSVWLVITRQKAAGTGLSLAAAVEEALCYGWIDGGLCPVDADHYCLRFSPRRRRSLWSENNKRRAARLMRQGRMTSAGLAAVAAAKANGEWSAASARENVDALPDDLALALRQEEAWAAFQAWPPSRKKQYLYWLGSARRPATRQKRLAAIVERALAGRPR